MQRVASEAGTVIGKHRRPSSWIGLGLDAGLRLWILAFLIEVMRSPNDPRFAGKAIPIRNLVVVLGCSALFPLVQALRHRWRRYPAWLDSLYLSIFWLDMAGNSFDLYDRILWFDLIPHAHGTGALAVALRGAFGRSPLEAAGLATIVHVALEAQEHYTDVFFGTHNVRGLADTVNDLTAGLIGVALYLTAFETAKRLAAIDRATATPA